MECHSLYDSIQCIVLFNFLKTTQMTHKFEHLFELFVENLNEMHFIWMQFMHCCRINQSHQQICKSTSLESFRIAFVFDAFEAWYITFQNSFSYHRSPHKILREHGWIEKEKKASPFQLSYNSKLKLQQSISFDLQVRSVVGSNVWICTLQQMETVGRFFRFAWLPSR